MGAQWRAQMGGSEKRGAFFKSRGRDIKENFRKRGRFSIYRKVSEKSHPRD
jgi:NADH:ubiquinone oxidoreductase subunit